MRMLVGLMIFFVCTTMAEQPSFFLKHIHNKKAFIYYPKRPISTDDIWQIFHEGAFRVPHMLEQAKDQQAMAVMILPENYDGLTPLDDNAPWVEGVRVALAWGSTYFRFEDVDVRVLHYNQQNSDEEIQRALNGLMSKNYQDRPGISCEEQMLHRVWIANDLIESTLYGIVSPTDTFFVDSDAAMSIVFDPLLDTMDKDGYRILVTGGAGFIGSHTVRHLLQQGHQVIIMDNLSAASYETIQNLIDNKQCVFFNHDVGKPFEIKGPLTHVLHLASLASPPFYYHQPKATLRSGLQGTKNTLDIAMKKNARYLFSSTSEVYGDPEISPQPEDYPGKVSPIGMRSQYDQSKRGGETLIKLYVEKFGIDARIVRIFNTYGPAMSLYDGRVVTNFIRAVLEKKPLPIYGDGLQTRSFAYVDDTVEGMLAVLFSEDITQKTNIKNRVFNIGNQGEFTIVALAKKLQCIAWQYGFDDIAITHLPQPDPWDPKQRRPDITRAHMTVGFVPKISLDEGLERTFLFFSKSKGCL